jgi:hypothetical protein
MLWARWVQLHLNPALAARAATGLVDSFYGVCWEFCFGLFMKKKAPDGLVLGVVPNKGMLP